MLYSIRFMVLWGSCLVSQICLAMQPTVLVIRTGISQNRVVPVSVVMNDNIPLHNVPMDHDSIKDLLKKGEDPTAYNYRGEVPLDRVLVELENTKNKNLSERIIMLFARALTLWGDFATLRCYLVNGVEESKYSHLKELDRAAIIKSIALMGDSENIVDVLWPSIEGKEIDHKTLQALVNKQDDLGGTFLAYAAVFANRELVQWLLYYGASPLIKVCNKNIFELVSYIMDNKNICAEERGKYEDILCLCVRSLAKNMYLLQRYFTGNQGVRVPHDVLNILMDKVTGGIVDRYKLLGLARQKKYSKNELVQATFLAVACSLSCNGLSK